MAESTAGRQSLARLTTTRTGAISQNETYTFDPSVLPAYGAWLGSGFAGIIVQSPITSAGAANLEITDGRLNYSLPGGGNQLTIPGPVRQLRIIARDAAVAGSGSDDVRITPLGILRPH